MELVLLTVCVGRRTEMEEGEEIVKSNQIQDIARRENEHRNLPPLPTFFLTKLCRIMCNFDAVHQTISVATKCQERNHRTADG